MASGKKTRKARTARPPQRKIMQVTLHTKGASPFASDQVNPGKRIKKSWRASGTSLSLKRWVGENRDQNWLSWEKNVDAWLHNKRALSVRKPGKIIRHSHT